MKRKNWEIEVIEGRKGRRGEMVEGKRGGKWGGKGRRQRKEGLGEIEVERGQEKRVLKSVEVYMYWYM